MKKAIIATVKSLINKVRNLEVITKCTISA